MRRVIAAVVGALLLGGCALYTEPVPGAAAGVYVAPPPIAVGPGPVWWAWHGHGWHGRWR